MWDTEHYNGVLVYLFLTDRAVDIAADRGTHIKVDSLEVESFRRKIVTNLRAGKYDAGVVSGIPRTVTRHLAKHSPAPDNSLPELPDRPVVQ